MFTVKRENQHHQLKQDAMKYNIAPGHKFRGSLNDPQLLSELSVYVELSAIIY